MIEFDISKMRIEMVHLKFITKSLGGTMKVLDYINEDGKEIFKSIVVPTHVVDNFIHQNMSRYLKPVLTAVCYYDDMIVALEQHPLGNLGKEKVKTLFGYNHWESSIERHIKETLAPETEHGLWFIDGSVVYRFNDETPINLTNDKKFQALQVNAYRLTDLALHYRLEPSVRNCIAFIANSGQSIISPPIWRTMNTIGSKKMSHLDGDEAVVMGIEENQFDKIDRLLSVNLNFALRASKVLIDNFGYDSIEPLRLDDLMVNLKTVNLPKLDKSIKNTHDIGMKFTHAMAWLIGLGAREMTLESCTAVRSMLRYLTSRGIVHKTALAKDNVFRKDKDMNSVDLMSAEDLKAADRNRQLALLEFAHEEDSLTAAA